MSEQGDNKDALLEKLDNLMRSSRARERLDPPPVLTDAIPKGDESTIPTLTDVVAAPVASPENDAQGGLTDSGQEQEVAADLPKDAPLEFEPSSPDVSDKDTPLEFERVEPVEAQRESADDFQQEAPTEPQEETPAELQHEDSEEIDQEIPSDSHEFISSRLLAVLDREITNISAELPAHTNKLSVLHRSLRFALPELVRLRWEETPNEGQDDDDDGISEPES